MKIYAKYSVADAIKFEGKITQEVIDFFITNEISIRITYERFQDEYDKEKIIPIIIFEDFSHSPTHIKGNLISWIVYDRSITRQISLYSDEAFNEIFSLNPIT